MTSTNYVMLTFTPDCYALRDFMRATPSPDGLMQLIRNPQFSFNLNLSEQQITYYEWKRYFLFHRVGAVAKRRLSLVNYLNFFFSKHILTQDVPVEKLREINEALKKDNDRNSMYAWDWVVYFGLLSLGLTELYVRIRQDKYHPIGYTIELSSKANRGQFNLSKKLRETFFDEQGNIILTDNMAPFLPKLVIEIDQAREKLGWQKISPKIFRTLPWHDRPTVEQRVSPDIIQALNTLPLTEYTRMYDLVYRDVDKSYPELEWIGIKIKELSLSPQTKIKAIYYPENREDLLDTLKTIFNPYEKSMKSYRRTKSVALPAYPYEKIKDINWLQKPPLDVMFNHPPEKFTYPLPPRLDWPY